MTKNDTFVELAAVYIGCPYIWGGKGDVIFSNGELLPNTFKPTHPLVFDCSGLVTYTLKRLQAMGILDLPDMTGSHSAKTIYDTFPIANVMHFNGVLLLYQQHVAIGLQDGFILDASGGDHTTTSPIEAMRRGARVQLHYNHRPPQGLLGFRRIPLDKSELRSI